MKRKNPLSLFKFIELLFNARISYNNVKNDEEIKKTTTLFGKRSLLYFLYFSLLIGISIGLIVWGVNNFLTTWLYLAIFAIILSVYPALYALGMFVLSFNLAIKQTSLNKKPVGILALVLNIIVLVVILLLIIIGLIFLSLNK